MALSDGHLCQAMLSQMSEVVLKYEPEETWPKWTTWKSRHGQVQQLKYSPAHDALMTLEVTTHRSTDMKNLSGDRLEM